MPFLSRCKIIGIRSFLLLESRHSISPLFCKERYSRTPRIRGAIVTLDFSRVHIEWFLMAHTGMLCSPFTGMFSLLEQIFLGYVLSFKKIKIKIYFSNFVGLGHNCLNNGKFSSFFLKNNCD
jgi:hypothetical protein